MNLLLNRTPEFLKHLFCGCGKPASIAWHKPLAAPTNKQEKLSKSHVERLAPKTQPAPMGWSCEGHIPSTIIEEFFMETE